MVHKQFVNLHELLMKFHELGGDSFRKVSYAARIECKQKILVRRIHNLTSAYFLTKN